MYRGTSGGPALGSLRRCPFPTLDQAPGNPLAGFGSPPECHHCSTASLCRCPQTKVQMAATARASRGFVPFSVSRPRGATYPGEIPTHRLRCALRVSHPPDALLPPRPAGLISSRSRSWGLPFGALFPPTVPYVVSNAATLVEFARPPRRPASPSGLGTPSGIPSEDLGFSQDPPSDAPLGFSPSRVSCPTRQPLGLPSTRPLSRFSGSAAC
jgi:hypothetical protein